MSRLVRLRLHGRPREVVQPGIIAAPANTTSATFFQSYRLLTPAPAGQQPAASFQPLPAACQPCPPCQCCCPCALDPTGDTTATFPQVPYLAYAAQAPCHQLGHPVAGVAIRYAHPAAHATLPTAHPAGPAAGFLPAATSTGVLHHKRHPEEVEVIHDIEMVSARRRRARDFPCCAVE